MLIPECVAIYRMERPTYDAPKFTLAFRRVLERLGLDAEHIGMDDWNPFSDLIRPGQRVLLKPNWVNQCHQYRPGEWDYVITHPAVLLETVKYAAKALRRAGEIVIADAPITSASFEDILRVSRIDQVIAAGQQYGIPITVLDLRKHHWNISANVIVRRNSLPGDPRGDTICNLGARSAFAGHTPSPLGYYGADYDRRETNAAHSNGQHKYKLSRTAIDADVLINLPKLKTHAKAGITCALKNLVGINTEKNWLPHHSEGAPEQGGDQCPAASSLGLRWESRVLGGVKQIVHDYPALTRVYQIARSAAEWLLGDSRSACRNGSWYGNDTLWRTILDLNAILLYANADGTLRNRQWHNAKAYFTIVDGIYAGEGCGPMSPDKREVGIIVAGANPVSVDCTCAKLMGFDYRNIPHLFRAFQMSSYPLCPFGYDDIHLRSNCPPYNKSLAAIAAADTLHFEPHPGWKSHIELGRDTG